MRRDANIAVILPCYNEELSIERTVLGFASVLPSASVYVIDNASTDRTAEIAAAAGAEVRRESRKGKGNALRRAFADIEADVYVIADGDGTYDPRTSAKMVHLLTAHELDMVTGERVHDDPLAYRAGHVLGDLAFSNVVAHLFGSGVADLFSGYRVFSRRFVKSFPSMSEGFEIESEMSIHALQLRMPLADVKTRYSKRSDGSASKLNTLRDGWRILKYVVRLKRLYQPRQFYGFGGTLLVLLSISLGIPILITFLEVGQVPRFPTAILATGIFLLGSFLWFTGVLLETTGQLNLEVKRLAYLALSPPRLSVPMPSLDEVQADALGLDRDSTSAV